MLAYLRLVPKTYKYILYSYLQCMTFTAHNVIYLCKRAVHAMFFVWANVSVLRCVMYLFLKHFSNIKIRGEGKHCDSRLRILSIVVCVTYMFYFICGVLIMIEIINLIDFSVLRLRNKTDSTWKQYNL